MGEGLCTLGAGVRRLASVAFNVCLQATGLDEIFITKGAGEERTYCAVKRLLSPECAWS